MPKTTRSMLLALVLVVTVLSSANVYGAEPATGLLSLKHRDVTVSTAPNSPEFRPGHTRVGTDTSVYLVNSQPTNPVWSRIMGEAATLYRVRVDDAREYDPNSVILGIERRIGQSVILSGSVSSERGREEMFHLRNEERAVVEALRFDATYMPDNGLVASLYATLNRAYDVPPGRDGGRFSPRRFNRDDYQSLSWHGGAIIGYGRTLFSTLGVRFSTGIASTWNVEDYQLTLNTPGLTWIDNRSRTASTTIPLDLTVRYHRPLSDRSHLLFQSSIGMNHTLKVHDGTTRSRVTSTNDGTGTVATTRSFDSMKNVYYAGAAVGYRRERLAAWLRYDQGRHGSAVTHQWTATLG
ncbi:MAG: hypothetical protein LIQ30_09670 [Planctomycetes bacterium]|nr:hypothetical protein [Planctomycetota bacterium]